MTPTRLKVPGPVPAVPEDAASDRQENQEKRWPTPPPLPGSRDGEPASIAVTSGFQVYLTDANLHDLLQAECLGRSSGVFAIRSRNHLGHLHLSDGVLVHAECGQLTGEPAALEILSWQEGEFRNVRAPLSRQRSIEAPLQSLLLRLARSSDEAAHAARQSQTIPSLPGYGPPAVRREAASDVLTELELGPTGELTSGRGVGVESLSGRVAYAARLVELIGRSLKSGKPVGAELQGETTCTSIEWRDGGRILGRLRPAGRGW